MATASRTWVFAANTEGLVEVGDSANIPVNWDATPQMLEFGPATGGANDSERARGPVTAGNDWTALFPGIPAGATITDVSCTAYNYQRFNSGSITNYRVRIRIVDSAGVSVHSAGELVDQTIAGTGTDASKQAGTVAGSRAVDAGDQAAATLVALEVQLNRTGGAVSNDFDIDDIAITVTYTTVAGEVSVAAHPLSMILGRPAGGRFFGPPVVSHQIFPHPYAFAKNAVLDSGVGSDEDPATGWGVLESGVANLKRVSNKLASSSGTGRGYWTATQFDTDQEAFATVDTLTGASNGLGVWVRVQNPGNNTTMQGYMAQVVNFNPPEIDVFRATAGHTITQIGQVTQGEFLPSIAAGDGIGLSVIDDKLYVWWRPSSGGGWKLMKTVIDSTISGPGYIGAEIDNITGRLTDFGGGNVFFTAVGGPITYQKTGALLGGSLFAGGDVFEAAEEGSILSKSLESGADVFTASEAGALVAGSLLAGADAVVRAEAGALLAASLLSGADASVYSETGSLLAKSLLAGADVAEHSRSGSVLAGSLVSGADVFLAAETGSLLAKSLLSGADAATFVETGALIAGAILSGADVFVDAETGKLLAGSFLSGPASKTGGGKTGSILAGGIVSGADSVARSRFGSLLAAALESGGDTFTAAEAGSLLAGALVEGARVRISVKSGVLLAGAFLSGATGRHILPGLEGFVVLIRADASVTVIGIEADATGESATARAQATFASADTQSIEAEGKTRRA